MTFGGAFQPKPLYGFQDAEFQSCIIEVLAHCVSLFPSYFVEVSSVCAMSTPELFCPLHTLAVSRYVEEELFFISLFFYVSVAYWYISSGRCWTQKGWQLLILAFSAKKGTCSSMLLHSAQMGASNERKRR